MTIFCIYGYTVLLNSCTLHAGQYGEGLAEKDRLSESHLMDLLHGSEYVLTYEDKDGDWMLVGDVPWEYVLVPNCMLYTLH